MLIDAWALVRQRWILFSTLGAAVLLLAALALPWDHAVTAYCETHRVALLRNLARKLRGWGEGTDTVIFVATSLALGRFCRRPAWARGAWATLLAVLCAAAVVNSVRVCAGRPRPRLHVQDGLRGPQSSYNYQSFPSGHSASSCAGAAALLVTVPWVGVPAALSAGGVMWASVYQQAHYLTDVLVGGGVGGLIGLAFGLSCRKKTSGKTSGSSLVI